MIGSDPRTSILDNDHGTANSTSIACDQDSLMVMVDIDANKFAKSTSTAEFPEVANEACRIPCETNYSTIDIDDEGARCVYFSASGKADV